VTGQRLAVRGWIWICCVARTTRVARSESGLLSSGGIGVSIGTRMQSSEQKFEQSGVTFALSSGLVSNLQSATKVVINRWWQYAP
jgi:hypothetical protein